VTIGLELGNGWADVQPAPWNGSVSKGAVPWHRGGAQRKAIALLSLTMSDGSTATVVTNAPGAPTTEYTGLAGMEADLVFGPDAMLDISELPEDHPIAQSAPVRDAGLKLSSTWTCGGGPRTNDSVYDGETFDARRQSPGWSAGGWTPPAALGWQPARAALPFAKDIKLQAQSQPPIQDMARYTVQNITKASSMENTYRFDFGQNMAGAVEIVIPAGMPSGFTITVVHAESIMHPPYGPLDGTVYVGNLRSARQTDVYIHDGSANVTHRFGEATQHGFRYALVTASGPGASDFKPTSSFITAVHFRTGLNIEGTVSVHDAAQLIDKVHHACAMVEASNLMGVVSDCDQRDEVRPHTHDKQMLQTFSIAEEITLCSEDLLYHVQCKPSVVWLPPVVLSVYMFAWFPSLPYLSHAAKGMDGRVSQTEGMLDYRLPVPAA